jgi:hypothetical protein
MMDGTDGVGLNVQETSAAQELQRQQRQRQQQQLLQQP